MGCALVNASAVQANQGKTSYKLFSALACIPPCTHLPQHPALGVIRGQVPSAVKEDCNAFLADFAYAVVPPLAWDRQHNGLGNL